MQEISKAHLVQLYCDEGLSCRAIGERLKCGQSTIARLLKTYGILMRKPGPPSGAKNPAWKGGRRVDRRGYVHLWMPDHPDATQQGYIAEHRFVMEQKIGRRLRRDENIHHRNGNKQDNRPVNLEILQNGQHRTLHQTSPLPPKHVLEGWYLRDRVTLTEIGKRVGRHYTTIAAHFRRLGIPIRKSNDVRMVPMPPDLRERYQNSSLREIASYLQCSVSTVRDALERTGIPIRKTGRLRDQHGVLLPPVQ